jgi:phosphate:Na+ symporter
MSSTFVLFDILGATALLIWGARMVRTGVSRAFGGQIHHWLSISAGNRFSAFGTGVGATFALQSSTATALIVAAFAGRGLIEAGMAQAVMLGANLGTALVAQILALDVHWLSSLLIFVGVAVFLTSDLSRRHAIGRISIGIGLMLLSLQVLNTATSPIRNSPITAALMTGLDTTPLLGLALGAALSALSSSSLAAVLLVMAFATNGSLTPYVAAVMVLGANIGGAVSPLLATMHMGPVARSVTCGNLIVRACGALAALPFIPFVEGILLENNSSQAHVVISIHLLFNIALALAFLPLIGPMARLLQWLFPPEAPQQDRPTHLEESARAVPVLALACAAQEALRVAGLVETMLRRSLQAFNRNDESLCAELTKMEDQVDTLVEEIKLYLARLGSDDMTDENLRRCQEIAHFVINMEHAGDIIDKNLSRIILRKSKRRLRFSDEGFAEIRDLYQKTIENIQVARGTFVSQEISLARQLVDTKAEIKRLESTSAARHLKRLRDGRVESIRTSSLHLDILRDLRRINAHVAAGAYSIISRTNIV